MHVFKVTRETYCSVGDVIMRDREGGIGVNELELLLLKHIH